MFFVYSSVPILPRNPFIIKIEAIEYNVCHIYEVIEYDVCHVYEVIEYDVCHVYEVIEYNFCDVYEVIEYDVCHVCGGSRGVGPNFCPYNSILPFSSCFTKEIFEGECELNIKY